MKAELTVEQKHEYQTLKQGKRDYINNVLHKELMANTQYYPKDKIYVYMGMGEFLQHKKLDELVDYFYYTQLKKTN
jgi:hypothetical protein